MKFATGIALKELQRNKIKLILATIISLILFMSAFLLFNLATALPENFYRFYTDNYSKDMKIVVNDADSALLDSSEQYFDSYALDYKYINEKFHLVNGDKTFSFINSSTSASGGWQYYRGEYATIGNIPKAITDLGDSFVLSGSLWQEHDNYQNIWIADIVADKIASNKSASGGNAARVAVGDKIKLNLELADREPSIYSAEMVVAGIYNYALAEENDAAFPVFFMRDDYAAVTYTQIYDSYRLVGEVKDISRFYGVYNNLNKQYTLGDNTLIDMIATVKNSEIICYIIGGAMLFGGMIVLMNFITMLISTNRKNIGVMLALGAKYSNIAVGYSMIYAGMIALVTIISLCLLPTINALIMLFCNSMGYAFEIKMHWLLLGFLYIICNIATAFIMWMDKLVLAKMNPIQIMTEED